VLIVAGALKLEAGGRIGRGPLTRALALEGDASYSLYLVQAPVIAAFAWLTPAWPAALRAPASVALAVGLGWICYLAIERPLASARALHHLPAAHRRGRRGLGPAEQEALAAVDPDLA
jgi:peptidoglycan/LPS O-acetylase OafA/YrhL